MPLTTILFAHLSLRPQLGDFLEGLVQRAVDVLELFFQLDAAEQAVRIRLAACATRLHVELRYLICLALWFIPRPSPTS